MKYKLINLQTKEHHLCDKVIIDGFDYYVSDVDQKKGDPIIHKTLRDKLQYVPDEFGSTQEHWFRIIATTNQNIDIPKVVDEVERLAEKYSTRFQLYGGKTDEMLKEASILSYAKAYNKSQETHPNSDEDMIEFSIWRGTTNTKEFHNCKNVEEQLQLWKEQQQLKIVYYE